MGSVRSNTTSKLVSAGTEEQVESDSGGDTDTTPKQKAGQRSSSSSPPHSSSEGESYTHSVTYDENLKLRKYSKEPENHQVSDPQFQLEAKVVHVPVWVVVADSVGVADDVDVSEGVSAGHREAEAGGGDGRVGVEDSSGEDSDLVSGKRCGDNI